MADKVKLVIEIPEVFYESLKETDVFISGQRSGKTLMSVIYNAVAKGTPLDSVKAEIKEKCDTINHITSHLPYSTHRFVQELLCEILESIDNAESEEK